MAYWVLLVWLIVGLVNGMMTRAMFKRKSSFAYIGDATLGGAGGVVGGYRSSHSPAMAGTMFAQSVLLRFSRNTIPFMKHSG